MASLGLSCPSYSPLFVWRNLWHGSSFLEIVPSFKNTLYSGGLFSSENKTASFNLSYDWSVCKAIDCLFIYAMVVQIFSLRWVKSIKVFQILLCLGCFFFYLLLIVDIRASCLNFLVEVWKDRYPILVQCHISIRHLLTSLAKCNITSCNPHNKHNKLQPATKHFQTISAVRQYKVIITRKWMFEALDKLLFDLKLKTSEWSGMSGIKDEVLLAV